MESRKWKVESRKWKVEKRRNHATYFHRISGKQPGVLNRVASLFRRRNFNIESLRGGADGESRGLTHDHRGPLSDGEVDAHKIEANLYKLINVIDVQDVTHQPSVTRDLALIKVRVEPERRAEVNGLAEIFRARIVDCGCGLDHCRDHRNRRQDRRHDRTSASALASWKWSVRDKSR